VQSIFGIFDIFEKQEKALKKKTKEEIMNLFKHLLGVCRYLSRYQLIKESCYSKSQLYQWLNHGVGERKARACKPVSEEVVSRAVVVISKYPHFSAAKGQCYMLYHQLGYIAHHVYKRVKKIVKCLLFQAVSKRKLLPERTSYNHERPEKAGEIWAEDFTQLWVCGRKFYGALVIDVAMCYTLGVAASLRPDDVMVEAPVAQALELTGGKGPQRFLLSDNGPQYISTKHGDFLEKLAILQKRIPSCQPEYNGSVECGIKEFKNVFYNVWAQIEESDLKGLGEEELLLCVQLVMNETMRRMNEEIPRPRLKGVTPADILKGKDKERIEINRRYLEKEQEKEKKEVIKPWNCKDWGFVRKQLFKGTISNLELMTKFCFFLKQPLRKLAKLDLNVLGN
jgi:transposase InsO family protein